LTFLERVRTGDQKAAEELVRMYESGNPREVRLRLRIHACERFDSVDICQSVMASFFVRAALGQYDLQKPDELIRLLVTMTRNKLVSQVRQAANAKPRSSTPRRRAKRSCKISPRGLPRACSSPMKN